MKKINITFLAIFLNICFLGIPYTAFTQKTGNNKTTSSKNKTTNIKSDSGKNNQKPVVINNDTIKKKETNRDDILDIIDNNKIPVIQGNDTAKVNWTTQYVEAKGWSVIDTVKYKNPAQARLMAVRGATAVAQRNLLEILNGVRVVGETTVKDMITENDYIYTRVDGILKGAEMVGQPKIADGIAEVTLHVPIYQPTPGKQESLAGVFKQALDKNPSGMRMGQSQITEPSMFPVIVDENNNIIFDYTKYFDPSSGKMPKYLNLSKQVLQELGAKKGLEVIEAYENAVDGKIKIKPNQSDKMEKWSKTGKTLLNIGKFLLLLI